MEIKVKQVTPPDLWRECAAVATGHDCKMPWAKMLAAGHSPIRASIWLLTLHDIPAFVVGHLVRHVHAQPYVQSKRIDRNGPDFNDECRNLAFGIRTNFIGKEDWITADLGRDYDRFADAVESLPEKYDRYAPQSIALLLNAEEIVNISRVRLCSKASPETREVWQAVVNKIKDIDPDLAKHCVPQCMYRGGICPEPKGCGYNKTELFNKQLTEYKKLFV